MSLSSDLIEQARMLAESDSGKPRMASLRRAVSTAYYGLFHFLVDKATRLIVSGTDPDRLVLRNAVARAFDHGPMRKISVAFGSGGTNAWRALFQDQPIPDDLKYVAQHSWTYSRHATRQTTISRVISPAPRFAD